MTGKNKNRAAVELAKRLPDNPPEPDDINDREFFRLLELARKMDKEQRRRDTRELVSAAFVLLAVVVVIAAIAHVFTP